MATKRNKGSERPVSARASGKSFATGRPLVVAWAGSQNAEDVVDAAAHMAEMLGERVVFATVANACGPPIFPCDEALDEQPCSAATASERAHFAAQRLRGRGIEVTEVVLGGEPAGALIAEAVLCSARVIMLGREDDEDGLSPSLGSLLERLNEGSPCPVFLAPRSSEWVSTKVTLDLRERRQTNRRSSDRARPGALGSDGGLLMRHFTAALG